MNGQIAWPTKEEIQAMPIDRLCSETHKASDAVVRWHGMCHGRGPDDSATKVYLHYRDVLEQMIDELAARRERDAPIAMLEAEAYITETEQRAKNWERLYLESLKDLSEQAGRAEKAEKRESARDGAYRLFLAVRERSQSVCRRCEPKLSVYEVAEEFDKLFPEAEAQAIIANQQLDAAALAINPTLVADPLPVAECWKDGRTGECINPAHRPVEGKRP